MYAAGISIRPMRSRHRSWLPGAWRIVVAMTVLILASLVLARVAAGGTAGVQTVVVQPGDTLWSIAVAHYPEADPRERVDAIERQNGLSGPDIAVGEALQLPPA